jgi:pantoate--beta-alanine ligase
VRQSASVCDITICSIFVNPTQFNDPGDFKKYPNLLENDMRLLTTTKADLLFIPPVSAIYPAGTTELEHYDLGYLESLMEGEFRPGHFQGVCQVMSRLLKIVTPGQLFMGQKDYQQCMVVKKLLTYLDFPVQLVTCPTIREPDGLAMSSRNLRLSPEERTKAPLIYQTLLYVKHNLVPGDLLNLKHKATGMLENGGFKVEYVAIANAATLQPADDWNGSTPLVVLVAAFLGEVRLIDNMLLDT